MHYLVELERWGITKGIPAKPYTDDAYYLADANIQGLNNAIQYARDNSYTDVVLPAGEYAICYPRPIQMLDGIHLKAPFSKLKVIYDSDRKSPFDNRLGSDYYNFVGISITFAKAEHSGITGLELEGCRLDRSFANPNEVAVEHSYGIVFEKSASFDQLEHCKVHDFMGDNISFRTSGYVDYTEFDEGCTVESLDFKTGLPIPVTSPKTLITKFLPIQVNTGFMFVGGAGYARLTSLTNKFFDVFFYRADNTFIGAHKKRRIYSDIEIPPSATKYRLQYYDEVTPRQHGLTVWFGRVPSHNIISQCEIYNGHRGGVTLGGSHNTLYKNVIRSNGKGLAYFLDGKPLFNDPTRYGINMEDSYGASCLIDDNEIYDCFHGVLVGCYDVEITRNKIHDTDFNAINLYAVSHAKITHNTLWNNLNNVGLQAPQFYYPYVEISSNTFTGGSLNFPATVAYRVDLKNNQLINPTSVILNDNCTMSDMHIVYTETVNATSITANKLKGCSIKSSQQIILRELIVKANEIDDCTFENLRVRFESQNNKVSAKIKIKESRFTGCEIRNHNFGAPVYLDVVDSKLTDTFSETGITNVDGINPYTRLYNCQINIASTGVKYLFVSDNTRQFTSHIAENCKITISHNKFDALLSGGFASQSNDLQLYNNEFTYTGTTPLALKFYKSLTHMKNFVESGNTYKNITLPIS